MTAREDIWNEIAAERDYQIRRWGTESDARINRPADWVLYISNYSSRWMNGFPPYDEATLREFRRHMVKTATLALAAIEETDKILDGENVRDDILAAK